MLPADKKVPKSFAGTDVTLQVGGEKVTRSVEEWCVIRDIPISRIYQRRRKFNTWEDSFSKSNLTYGHTKNSKLNLIMNPRKMQTMK